MATKDLINLGISPDSGTGDSARKGGAKINELLSDVYSKFGDNPIGQDVDKPFYGYRRRFGEFEYRVGELHPAGKYLNISFRTVEQTRDSDNLGVGSKLLDATRGWRIDADSDNDGIPDLYLDSEFYFVSRGETIDVDVSGVDTNRTCHVVLPLAQAGDVIKIRESRGSFSNGRSMSVWTTPFRFKDSDQRAEWSNNSQGVSAPQNKHTFIRDIDGVFQNASVHGISFDSEGSPFAQRSLGYAVPFAGESSVYGVKSPIELNSNHSIYEFTYSGHDIGWVFVRHNIRASARDSDNLKIYTDVFDSDDWHKTTANFTIGGVTEVPSGRYMLPITRYSFGDTTFSREFENLQSVMDVKVFKSVMQQGNKTTINNEVLEFIRTQLYNSIDSEMSASNTDSDKVQRFKTVWGTQGADSDSAQPGSYTNTNNYGADGYTGFDDVDKMFIPVDVTTVMDNEGNAIVFSQTKFKGQAKILTLG